MERPGGTSVTPTSATVVARLEARANEDMVMAEGSLLGERRVAKARIAMLALFAVAQGLISPALGHDMPLEPSRMVAVVLYGFLAVAAIYVLNRRKPNPRRAMVMPLIITVVDFTFVTSMAVFDHLDHGRVWPEMGAITFAVILCFSVARYSWIHVAWSTFLACVCYLGIGVLASELSPVSTPFVIGGFVGLGILIAATNLAVRNLFTGLRRRDNLTRFLPRAIAERILSGGAAALAPVQAEVTVLFSDIRGFTELSEQMPPREVLRFLDEYFGQMSQIVKGHDGVVNKFLGDGMLAFWGLPDRVPDHAIRAVRAALDMRRALDELNQVRAQEGKPPVRIGVGIHTGTVAAGMLGGPDQHEYTVIGDAVNVASRIEGITKQLGADILVSESTWRALDGKFAGQRVSEESLRGRKGAVVVYALDPREDAVALPSAKV